MRLGSHQDQSATMKSLPQNHKVCQPPKEPTGIPFGKKPNKLKALLDKIIYPFLPEGKDWEPPKGDKETWGEFA